jgi:hypothetical protein
MFVMPLSVYEMTKSYDLIETKKYKEVIKVDM